MTESQRRQPRGTPTGGQFAASTRTEATVALIADLDERFAGDDPGHQWSWSWAPRSKAGPTCPDCDTIHGSDAAVAEGRFDPDGPRGHRSRLGGPLRDTRDEAHGDYCLARQQTRADGGEPATATPAREPVEPVCDSCGRTISDTPARDECEDWHTPGIWDPEG